MIVLFHSFVPDLLCLLPSMPESHTAQYGNLIVLTLELLPGTTQLVHRSRRLKPMGVKFAFFSRALEDFASFRLIDLDLETRP
jgi:hypothetical protein